MVLDVIECRRTDLGVYDIDVYTVHVIVKQI